MRLQLRKDLFFGFMLFFSSALFSPLLLAINWSGSTDSSDNAVNQNVVLQDDVTLEGPVEIRRTNAATTEVTLSGADRIIQRGEGANAPGRLYLRTEHVDSVIKFKIQNNLTFKGNENGSLLVSIEGPGTVTFELFEGKEVVIGSCEDTDGGVKVLLIMSPDNPTLKFVRKENTSDEDVTVSIGARSMMSYLSDDDVGCPGTDVEDRGSIIWDPSNASGKTGRMILRVEDDGSMVISGHRLGGGTDPDYTLADVDFKDTPVGCEALFKVVRDKEGADSDHAGLLVLSCNRIISPLRVDPFGINDFMAAAYDGIRRGFVLGASGRIELADKTYLDYVGLALNKCPNPPLELQECELCEFLAEKVKHRNGSAFIVDGCVPLGTECGTPARVDLLGSSGIYFRSGIDCECNSGGECLCGQGDGTELFEEVVFDPRFSIDPTKMTLGEGAIVFAVEGPLDIFGATSAVENALEVLSIPVNVTGGSITTDSITTVFPKRFFTSSRRYNKSCFFINNMLNMYKVSLNHTDDNHAVYEKNDVDSEPTYIGGDTHTLKENEPRPSFNLFNSYVRLHTSMASTGVDWVVPNFNQ